MSYERKERLLTIENLSVAYGDKVIIKDINLAIDNVVRPNMSQGQVIALLGPSGIGKTQLFRCIAGLQQPTTGQVRFYDKKESVKAGEVGFVFQHYPLLQHRTLQNNLELAADKHKRDRKVIGELLAQFGLADRANLFPSQLSGGQRQRAAIIQQLICSNHFILMDEPFSGLDVIAKKAVCDMILHVTKLHEFNTIIFTTHDIDAAVSVADTIWVLGRNYDSNGNLVPGAVIRDYVDLIESGIAWNPNPDEHPEFARIVHGLKELFLHL